MTHYKTNRVLRRSLKRFEPSHGWSAVPSSEWKSQLGCANGFVHPRVKSAQTSLEDGALGPWGYLLEACEKETF